MDNFKLIMILLLATFFFSGCAVVLQKGRRSDIERIRALEEELTHLKRTKDILEERLAQEIKDKQVRLKMEKKGLVVTFVAEVLFDPGKAELKKESFPILDKVARVLKEEVPQHHISIEGHTDNQPIRYSPWKSNWELSAHRALSVLHYLKKEGVSPQRMSVSGFGEYKPVASNATAEGRALNRRVEIVIVPIKIEKIKKPLSTSISKEELPQIEGEVPLEEELK